ncbi:putative Nucleotide-binding, alpha-beta plait, RNA recognition motif domain protein, partial [Trachipleistophora hominis]
VVRYKMPIWPILIKTKKFFAPMAKKQLKKQQKKDESSVTESEQSVTESSASTEISDSEESANAKEASASDEKQSDSEEVSSEEESEDASAESIKKGNKQQTSEKVEKAALDESEDSSCASSLNDASDAKEKMESGAEQEESGSDAKSSAESSSAQESNSNKQSDKSQSDDATIFVKGFDKDVTELMVEEEFGKIGKVVNVRMPKDRDTSENKGFCYVEFSNAQSAKKALTYNGKTLLDCQIVIDTPKKAGNFCLFVKNLPYTATVDDIKKVFAKYNVKNVRLPTDEDEERNRGFCFIEFNTEQDMRKVLNNKFNMDERKLFINEPKDKRDRGNGGFSRDRRDGDKGFSRGNNRERRFNDRGGFNKNDRRNAKDRGNKRYKENENKKIVFDDNSD